MGGGKEGEDEDEMNGVGLDFYRFPIFGRC